MKKALYSALMLVMFVVSLSACKKNDDGGGGGTSGQTGGTVATTPAQTCNIPGYTGCTPQVYQQYNANFLPYNVGANSGYGFCGCPATHIPVMNPTWGLSCAPRTYIHAPTSYDPYWGYGNVQYMAYSYNTYNAFTYYSQNGQVTSIPQIRYTPPYQAHTGACPSVAITACDLQMSDSWGRNVQCGYRYCQPTSAGSRLGICSYSHSGGYNDSYGYGRRAR